MEILEYVSRDGQTPFSEWLNALKDRQARARIRVRLDRISLGNLGDHKPIGNGIYELRFSFGPGYRVYFGKYKQQVILLLGGGDKNSQSRDIEKVKHYWNDFLEHEHES